MSVKVYEKGDTVRLKSTYLALDKARTDPTTVVLSVLNPSGQTSHYYYASGHITKEATGVYYYDIALNITGRWTYRWVGTGPVAGATEDRYLDVRYTVF